MADYDLKTLFHNPEELTDKQLYQLRGKIKFQRYVMPFFGAFSSTMFMMTFFGPRQRHLVLLGAVGGYLMGMGTASMTRTFVLTETIDRDIMKAWD